MDAINTRRLTSSSLQIADFRGFSPFVPVEIPGGVNLVRGSLGGGLTGFWGSPTINDSLLIWI